MGSQQPLPSLPIGTGMTNYPHYWNAQGLLFDLDGTLVDSQQAITAAWTALANRRSLPIEEVIRLLPGRRASDVLTLLDLPRDTMDAELGWLENEQNHPGPLAPIPGALPLTHAIPPGRWAVVTAAPESVAWARLDAAGLPRPQVLVGAEAVDDGKPAPDGYLRAAERLGISPADCVVFEDAKIGIEAGRAAGCRTIGIGAQAHGADQQITDYSQLQGLHIGSNAITWSLTRQAKQGYDGATQ